MYEEGLIGNQVFCYGTLLPGQERWQFLAPYVLDYQPDQVVGRVYDTVLGYPAADFDCVGVVHGIRFRLDPGRLEEALSLLDEIEGAEALASRVVNEALEVCGSVEHLRKMPVEPVEMLALL